MENNNLFRHIPTKRESQAYFEQWLSEDPSTTRVNYFFVLLLGIHGIHKIELVEPRRRGQIRVIARTLLGKLNPKTKEVEDKKDTYVIDIRFDEYEGEPGAFLLSFSQEKRLSLFFDPTKRDSYSAMSKQGVYHYEIVMGVDRVADIIKATPSPNPAMRFYEGSVAWCKAEFEKELSNYGHIGDSSLTMAKFVEDNLLSSFRRFFGEYAYASCDILDVDAVHIAITVPQEIDFASFFEDGPWGVDVYLEFRLCLSDPVLEPVLTLGYEYLENESGALLVKEREIHDFVAGIVSNIQGLSVIAYEDNRKEYAIAVGEPYLADFTSIKGRNQFVGYLINLSSKVYNAFRQYKVGEQ